MPSPQELKTIGLKATLPRLKILEIFQSGRHRHMSAEDVYRDLLAEHQDIGLATVYRSLKALIEAGDVAVVTLPGDTPRYELAHLHHHHHFHCRACGGVFEVEGCPGDLAALAPSGFAVDGHEVVLYGRCARCAS